MLLAWKVRCCGAIPSHCDCHKTDCQASRSRLPGSSPQTTHHSFLLLSFTSLMTLSDISAKCSLNREKGVKCQLADLNRSTGVRLSTCNSGYLGRQWRSTHWHLCDRTPVGWMPILLVFSGSLKKSSARLNCSIHHQHLDQLLGIPEVIEISF